jgi:hypothetical protein
MNLGWALIVCVVLVLTVYHKGFRKVFFWFAGVTVILAGLTWAGLYLYGLHEDRIARRAAEENQRQAAAEHKKDVDACKARFLASGSVESVILDAMCDESPDAVPKPVTIEPDFIPDKPASKKPFITATIRKPNTTDSAKEACSDVILWSQPKFMSERHALFQFKGGEQVEYIGENSPDDAWHSTIVKYHGKTGYVDGCVDR